ncbi:MAG TPA: O-antigen ligase family protein [Candidatus Limnocylindria bacterium]
MSVVRILATLAAVGLTVAVMGYVAWDGAMWDPRYQLALHLAAVVMAGGMLWMVLAGAELPRSRVELPVLLLLLAFAIASLTPWNAGLSAQALASICGMALVLPAAAIAIRHRPTLTALAVTLPVLVLAALSLWGMLQRRTAWIEVDGPGFPPIRLARETTNFGSVAVAPFVLLALAPVVLLIGDRRLRLAVLAALFILAVPLTILSGSRSAWIAMAAAAVVLIAPWVVRQGRGGLDAWRQATRRLTPRGVGLAFVAAVGLVLAVAAVGSRLTDLRSLLYRGFLWRDTLNAWSADPLFGIGPGSMPFARQAAAPALSFPVRQPHSHDIPLGILGDTGLVGVAAAAVLLVTFVMLAGPWRTRSLRGRAAFAVLAGCGVGMLFEDLTFLPGFSILLVLLAAMALTDAGAIGWQTIRPAGWQRPVLGVATGLGAAALVVVMSIGDAAAIVYRQGTDQAGARNWPAALAELQAAERLNPWQPTAPKAVAVAADRSRQPALARAAAERAAELSPGDGSVWTNLAILCRQAGDRECARQAADRAVDTATIGGVELANAALTYDWLGDHAAADRAYRLSMLVNLWTSLTLTWSRQVTVGDEADDELGVDAAEMNLLVARRVTEGAVNPADYQTSVVRALAFAMTGDRSQAEAESQRAIQATPESSTAWEVDALLKQHYGEDNSYDLRVGTVARGAALGSGRPYLASLIFDIATFRAYPSDGLVGGAERLRPKTPWPWALERYLAP